MVLVKPVGAEQNSSSSQESSAHHVKILEKRTRLANSSEGAATNDMMLWSDVVQSENLHEGDVSAKPKDPPVRMHQAKHWDGKDFKPSADEGKVHDIVCIMDSNRKFLDFSRVFPGQSVLVIPCGNIDRAAYIVENPRFKPPRHLLIHVGVNDVESALPPEDIANNVIGLAVNATRRFPQSKISVSLITPRADELARKVMETNKFITRAMIESVNIIVHDNLHNEACLFDKKHLNKRVGVPLLARNFSQSVCGKSFSGNSRVSVNQYQENSINGNSRSFGYQYPERSTSGNSRSFGYQYPEKSTSGNSRTFGEPNMMMQMIREIREMNRNLQSFLPFQRS